MAQQPLATKGNFLHIYDFHVAAGHEDEFIRSFEAFDYSDGNPMHKSSAQVKDGVLCRDVDDPQRFFLIAGRFVPKYVEVVSSTPDEILRRAAE